MSTEERSVNQPEEQPSLSEQRLIRRAKLKELQDEYRFTEKMMLAEAAKSMPFGTVWDEYCTRQGVPTDLECYPEVARYEEQITSKRK